MRNCGVPSSLHPAIGLARPSVLPPHQALTPPPQSGLQLTVRLEELRLLESRKSSRLSGQANTDFSKLADFNIVHERKRLNSEKSSDGSEFFG